MHYCGCDIQLQSVITVSDEGETPRDPDRHVVAWETRYVPSVFDREILLKLRQKLPHLPDLEEGETPSIPETPCYHPDQGDVSPEDPAMGTATREAMERMTQTPPLLSRLIQGYLDHTGIEACPYHQMDHGVRDPDCDHCKRALGPLYHHKIVGNRHLPVFTFDFSGPHTSLQNSSLDAMCSSDTNHTSTQRESSRISKRAPAKAQDSEDSLINSRCASGGAQSLGFLL